MHFMFDGALAKCCFSSTMKLKSILPLGAMLAALIAFLEKHNPPDPAPAAAPAAAP